MTVRRGLVTVGVFAGTVILIDQLASGRWWVAALILVLGVFAVWNEVTHRSREAAAEQARAEWTPDRVAQWHSTLPDPDVSEVAEVRALRQADPRLGLADAVALVRSARSPG